MCIPRVRVCKKNGGYDLYAKNDPNRTCRVCYLVPNDWVDIKEVEFVTWQKLLCVLKQRFFQEPNHSVLRQFLMLLDRKFGVLSFDENEASVLTGKEFAVPEMLRLLELIRDVSKKLGVEKEVAGDQEEYGATIQRGTLKLFFGLWTPYWDKVGGAFGLPLCFSIASPDESEAKAFTEVTRGFNSGIPPEWIEGDLVCPIPRTWLVGEEPGVQIADGIGKALVVLGAA